ncbi:MAG: hypothetical protein ACRDY2_00750 [Acidimicrobiales bacterium]
MTNTIGKIAVSLPQSQIDAARQAVAEGRATSVSAYVSGALSRVERDTSLTELVAELIGSHGAPAAEDFTWADEVLGYSR